MSGGPSPPRTPLAYREGLEPSRSPCGEPHPPGTEGPRTPLLSNAASLLPPGTAPPSRGAVLLCQHQHARGAWAADDRRPRRLIAPRWERARMDNRVARAVTRAHVTLKRDARSEERKWGPSRGRNVRAAQTLGAGRWRDSKGTMSQEEGIEREAGPGRSPGSGAAGEREDPQVLPPRVIAQQETRARRIVRPTRNGR